MIETVIILIVAYLALKVMNKIAPENMRWYRWWVLLFVLYVAFSSL